MNIFAAFGAKDGFVEIEFSKEQMNKILGKNEHLVIKEYKNYEHQVYVEELKDMKKFILSLIKWGILFYFILLNLLFKKLKYSCNYNIYY